MFIAYKIDILFTFGYKKSFLITISIMNKYIQIYK